MAGSMTLHRRCGAGPGGPSRASSGVPIRTPGAVTAARRTVLPSQECRRMPGPKDGGVVTQQVSPSRGGADHRGGCGASLKHRARDALGLADLRHEQTLRQASMSRGVEARGSFWTPGVPRALGWGRAQRSKEDGPSRGLDKEYGRWRLGLPDCLASFLEAGGRRVPATPVTVLQQF